MVAYVGVFDQRDDRDRIPNGVLFSSFRVVIFI